MSKFTSLKKEKGGILTYLLMLIVVAIIFTLLAFLIYQIVFNDILGIMKKEPVISDLQNMTQEYEEQTNLVQENTVQNSIVENVEIVTPIIDEKQENVPENIPEHIEEPSLNNGYYYEQLDSYGKTIYKAILNNKENMKQGNYVIDFGTAFNELLNTENGEQKLNTAFQSAWNAFTYDNVDTFYLDITKLVLTTETRTLGDVSTHRVKLSQGENKNYLSSQFSSYEKIKTAEDYLINMRQQVVNALQNYSDYDKIRYLHNWMIDNMEYDTTLNRKNAHNIYGALKEGIIVCEGYARTFKYMLDGLGIPCVLVSGTATNSSGEQESHAWNYVQLDGKWYAVDVTWDDPVISGNATLTDNIRYKYFLVGSDNFFENHKEDGTISENSIKFKFPTLSITNVQ